MFPFHTHLAVILYPYLCLLLNSMLTISVLVHSLCLDELRQMLAYFNYIITQFFAIHSPFFLFILNLSHLIKHSLLIGVQPVLVGGGMG